MNPLKISKTRERNMFDIFDHALAHISVKYLLLPKKKKRKLREDIRYYFIKDIHVWLRSKDLFASLDQVCVR